MENPRQTPTPGYPALLNTHTRFRKRGLGGLAHLPGSKQDCLTLRCSEEPRAQNQQHQKQEQRLEFPPRSHVCRYSTRTRHRWLFSDVPVSSEERQGYKQSQIITRGQGERETDPGPQTGRAPDASCRSARPARFALIASVPSHCRAERLQAPTGLPGQAGPGTRRPSWAGRHQGGEAAGGGRRGASAQPGETWSRGSWRESQRVGAAGGRGGAGGRRASLEREGGERRRQAASGTRSRCRGGWTQPSLPTERGRRLGRAQSQTEPSLGPSGSPRLAALHSASRAAARRLEKGDSLGARVGDTHATRGERQCNPATRANWRDSAGPDAGFHLLISFSLLT